MDGLGAPHARQHHVGLRPAQLPQRVRLAARHRDLRRRAPPATGDGTSSIASSTARWTPPPSSTAGPPSCSPGWPAATPPRRSPTPPRARPRPGRPPPCSCSCGRCSTCSPTAEGGLRVGRTDLGGRRGHAAGRPPVRPDSASASTSVTDEPPSSLPSGQPRTGRRASARRDDAQPGITQTGCSRPSWSSRTRCACAKASSLWVASRQRRARPSPGPPGAASSTSAHSWF